MGLIPLVMFLAQSFDHLAWPLITLVYPLYASIRAIESNCNTQSKKWLTYWILFALILLFEVTIVKINQWLPVWHHIKLITTFWLVVPHSDGAFYVYENILRPCFSVNLKTFVQWFKIRKEEVQIHSTDDFLLLAERYIEENGSQSLEKLIKKSPSLCMEHNHGRIEHDAVVRTEMEAVTTATMEVNVVEPNILRIETKAKEENKLAEATAAGSGERYIEENGSHSLEKLIEKSPSLCMEHNHGRIENDAVVRTETEANDAVVRTETEVGTTATMEVNDMKPNNLRIETKAEKVNNVSEAAAAASGEPNSVLDPKKSQKEWTCALCQVTTTGESNLTDHLNGKKHKAKEEERLANMTPTKNRNSSIAVTPLHNLKTGSAKLVSAVRQVANVGVLKGTGGHVEKYNKTKNVSVAEANKHQPRKDSKKALSTTGSQVEQMNKKKNRVLNYQSAELWCDTCKLMCGSQFTLTSHLSGKKHLNRLKNESMTSTS